MKRTAGRFIVSRKKSWSPLLLNNLLAWYDASDLTTITDTGGEVTAWADKSGNGNNLTSRETTSDGRSQTGSNTQNLLNVIDVDANDFFDKTGFQNPSSGNIQIMLVCKVTLVDNYHDSIITMDVATGSDFQLEAAFNASPNIFKGRINTNLNGTTATGNNAITGFNIWHLDFDKTDDAEYQLNLNGAILPGTTATPYSTKIASNVHLKLFQNRAGNQSPGGQIAESIIFEDVEVDTRQKAEGYLAHKWGLAGNLPAAHPYKVKDPSAGGSSRFIVSRKKSWSLLSLNNLFAWYDASDLTTITDTSGEVTVWADKSGNSRDLTGVDNPVTGASSQNSLNVIDLDGGDYFELDGLSTPTSGDLQAFIVCNVTNVSHNADSILAMLPPAADASSNGWQLQAGRSNRFVGRLDFLSQMDTSTGAGDTNLSGYHIYCADLDFTDDVKYRLLIDGELIASEKTYNSKLASTVDFKIFANRRENQFPQGSIAEVILLDNTDNLTRQKVEGYLAHKWGLTGNLPAAHPYKVKDPSAGGSSRFFVRP